MADQKPHRCANELRVDDTALFHIAKARLVHVTIHIGRLHKLTPPLVETLVQLLIDFPCHKCHKNSLKAILDMASKFKPDLLFINFVIQTVINVQLNENLLDWELVQVILGIIKSFLRIVPDESKKKILVNDVKLLPMARMLLSRCFANGQADCNKSLAEDVLDLFSIAFVPTPLCQPDEQLIDNLIKSFAFHPGKAFSIACLAIEPQEPMHRMRDYNLDYSISGENGQFWTAFSRGVHKAHRSKWLSDKAYAHEYVTVLANYEKHLNTKNGCGCTHHYEILMQNNATAIVEVLLEIDIIPSEEVILFLVQHGRPVEKNVDLIHFLTEKITWMSTNERVKLHHAAVQNQFTYNRVNRSMNVYFNESTRESMIIHSILNLCYNVDNDCNFTKALITLANYDHINSTESYKSLIEAIINHNDRYQTKTLLYLESGIAQTICGVINNLHERCSLCKVVIKLMNKLLKSVTPDSDTIRNELHIKKNAKLAAALPFVIRDREKLFSEMSDDGLNLLTNRLEQGEDIESLQMLAKVCRYRPPFARHWETFSCTSEQPIRTESEGTRVIVLDDGTKIRAETSPLIENSEFFYKLFDGMFAEASQEEIRLHDVTAFQFRFLVNFTAAPESSTRSFNFDMDVQEHLDLLILCDKLLMPTLGDQLLDSLRWHHLDAKLLPELYNFNLADLLGLRKICLDFALEGDAKHEPKPEWLRGLFENVDRKLLLADIKEWISVDLRTSVKNALLEKQWSERVRQFHKYGNPDRRALWEFWEGSPRAFREGLTASHKFELKSRFLSVACPNRSCAHFYSNK